MRLLGFEVSRPKKQKGFESVDSFGSNGGWFSVIRETFAGAWQALMPVASQRDLLAFSAVYASVTLIASDIAKLCVELKQKAPDGICRDAPANVPFWRVLRKPNHYQSMIQLLTQWIVSKLLFGNAYLLKERQDGRGMVTALYVLHAPSVTPLVTDDGGVYYQIKRDTLSGVPVDITVPASEIIHDTMTALWHPLVGVSPIYACGMSADMGRKIQSNSSRFFGNMSRPSGQLTAPGKIDDETANRLKTEFERQYSQGNLGRLFVAGSGLQYQPMVIPAVDAQLIEQLKWTVEDVARCFHIPLYKLGGSVPPNTTIEALNQGYYSECLQILIEALEDSLGSGLELKDGYEIECDLEGLLRMDTAARFKAWSEGIKGGWLKPDEGRAKEGLPPVDGGNACYLQQQNFSLAALAKRDALPNPFVIDRPTTNPTPSADGPPAAADPSAKHLDSADDLEMVPAFGILAQRKLAPLLTHT